jgi:hypothetical protein
MAHNIEKGKERLDTNSIYCDFRNIPKCSQGKKNFKCTPGTLKEGDECVRFTGKYNDYYEFNPETKNCAPNETFYKCELSDGDGPISEELVEIGKSRNILQSDLFYTLRDVVDRNIEVHLTDMSSTQQISTISITNKSGIIILVKDRNYDLFYEQEKRYKYPIYINAKLVDFNTIKIYSQYGLIEKNCTVNIFF